MKSHETPVEPQISDARQHAQWNEHMVQKYDPDLYHRHQNPIIRWIESRRVRAVLRHIQTNKTGRVLEVGCGAGNVLEQARGDVLFGVDLSRFILKKAKTRLKERAHILCASAEHLPYGNASFDCVYCTEVIEHTLDPYIVVAEMLRVLQPGGVLIVSVPNEKVIDRLKEWIARLGLYRLFFSSGDFASPMTNEWHLHDFDRKLLITVMGDDLEKCDIVSIPLVVLPLRYVAVGIKRREM